MSRHHSKSTKRCDNQVETGSEANSGMRKYQLSVSCVVVLDILNDTVRSTIELPIPSFWYANGTLHYEQNFGSRS
ncbi:hypothetical protein LINGRAHAP2_LOCUS3567 [Linum grandiflorum]